MNQIKAIIILIIIGISLNTYGQKFRSLEKYKNYFIQNNNTIDKIEGVWFVNLNIYADGLTPINKEFTVVIIKENSQFYQYTIEDGYYSPSGGYKKFNKNYSSYKCIEYDDQCNITMTSSSFSITKKRFSYNLNATNLIYCLSNGSINRNTIKRYSYSKLFPLESDISESRIKEIKSKKTTGTGFAISSNGYIVTNYHVVKNASTIKIKGVKGDFQKSYSAKIVLSDKNNDLTILKITDYSFSNLGTIPYTLKSKSINVGSDIFVLGYPLTATMGEEIKLTNGIISAKSGFQGDITSYQMTAAIQPGNSGAPMFDKYGYITGIVNAKLTNAENAGYAIKTTYLFNLIDAVHVSIKLPKVNKLSGKSLSTQVGLVKDFIYIIEVN